MYSVGAVAFMGQIPSMTIVVLNVFTTIYYFYGGSFGCVVTDDSDFKELWNLSHIVQQYYPKIVATIHDNDLVP